MKSDLMAKIDELKEYAEVYENKETTQPRKNLASDNIKNTCSRIFHMTYSH